MRRVSASSARVKPGISLPVSAVVLEASEDFASDFYFDGADALENFPEFDPVDDC